MNTTKVELPDGRLLCIEGAEAPQVASLISNALVRNVPPHGYVSESPLEVPALNFAQAPAAAPAVVAAGDEMPLALPQW